MESLALLISLWASLTSFLSSVDWLSIAAYLAATGAIGLLGMVWRSRAALASRLPWLVATFELLEVVGFSPTALRSWVVRRSWYQAGVAESARLLDELSEPEPTPPIKPPSSGPPSMTVLMVVLGALLGGACTRSLPPTVCGIPTDRVLPLAISLARSAVSVALDTCSPSCPDELLSASAAVNRVDAGREQVCSAVSVARTVPCIHCAEHLDSVATLAGCDPHVTP